MRRNLFLPIQLAVETHELYLQQRRTTAKKLGLSSLQKIIASLRMLAYGVTGDFVDEYVRLGKGTTNKSLKIFVKTVIYVFDDEYLRSLNSDDIARLLAIGEIRDFPGMLGSIDCMNWKWKNCPSAWKAQGRALTADYSINGHNYEVGYYLADGIYSSWVTFVKTIPQPLGNKKKYFAQRQEPTRKDVERAFGVLQMCFAIMRGHARFFHKETLKDIMMAYIILHNMIVEDEKDLHVGEDISSVYDQINIEHVDPTSESNNQSPKLVDFIQRHHHIRDKEVHSQLQIDLVEHLW